MQTRQGCPLTNRRWVLLRLRASFGRASVGGGSCEDAPCSGGRPGNAGSITADGSEVWAV